MDLNQTATKSGSLSSQPNTRTISYDDIIDEDILVLMGAKNMPPEKKEELYNKMIETIQLRVLARIDDQLSDQEAEEIAKIVKSEDKAKFFEFLKGKDINIEKLYAEEALIYKIEMIELINSRGNNAKA
jgi:hypothetical protein